MRVGNWRWNWAISKGYPPKQYRKRKWEYNRAMYQRRKEVERLFRRLKGFRRIFSRFEQLDVMCVGLINVALIADGLRIV